MSFAFRMLAVGLAAMLTFIAPGWYSPRAEALPSSTSAQEAAQFIVDRWEASPAGFTNGLLADAILALASSENFRDEALAMTDKLKTEAAQYAVSGGAAGKVALAAYVTNQDPRDFGGVDLIAVVNNAVADNPAVGGGFNMALAILGLDRNSEPVPSALIQAAIDAQDASGAYGYNYGVFSPDPDYTAIMMAALMRVEGEPGVAQALEDASQWLLGQRNAEGYWPNQYSPANTTGLAASVFADQGEDVTAAITWMESQQLPDGGLPNTLDGDSSDVRATVQAILALAETSYATVPGYPLFTDVGPGDPFYDDIQWMAHRGLAKGYDDGSYRPGDSVHRGAMAAFMYREAGSPPVPAGAQFGDVEMGDPFYLDINWMGAQGISEGYADGTYRAHLNVHRGAMAAFMYRAASRPVFEAPAESPFTDLEPGDPFYLEICWMAESGISNGYADGSYRPALDVHRAAMAAFLHRLQRTT